MPKQFRRVVTGHDASGKAVVLSDGPAPFRARQSRASRNGTPPTSGGPAETPARIVAIAGASRRSARGGRCRPSSGSVIRINHFPPEPEAVRQMTPGGFAQGVRGARQRKGRDVRQGRAASADASHRDDRLCDRPVRRDHHAAGRGRGAAEGRRCAGRSAAPITPGAIAPNAPCVVAFVLIDGEFEPALAKQFG